MDSYRLGLNVSNLFDRDYYGVCMEDYGCIRCEADLIGDAVLDLNVMVRRPLRCRVDRVPGPVGPDLRACYLLALAPFSGLERLDLVEVDPGAKAEGPALWIDILG